MTRQAVVRALLAAAFAVSLLWAANFLRLDAVALEQQLRGSGAWAPGIFVALYALGAVLFVPGAICSLAGGALFGPVWGSVLNLTGATLGATVAFLIAKYLAGDWVARRAGGRLKQIIEGVEGEGWRFVALVRLVPLFPFNLVNYALGLTRIRFGHFVLASLVCMAPGAVAYTWVGYAGRELARGSETALRSGLIALALLGMIAFVPRLARRLRGSPAEPAPPWLPLAPGRRGAARLHDPAQRAPRAARPP